MLWDDMSYNITKLEKMQEFFSKYEADEFEKEEKENQFNKTSSSLQCGDRRFLHGG